MRWLALHDGGGGGLAVAAAGEGAAALQINVSRYRVESFDRARHDHELEVRLICPLLQLVASSVTAAAGAAEVVAAACFIFPCYLSVPPAACCTCFRCRLRRMPPLPGIQRSAERLEPCLLLPPSPRTYTLTHARTTTTTTHTLARTHSRQLPTTTHRLQASDHLHVYLDCAHMGVGGDDSWSPTGKLEGRGWDLVGCIMLNPSVLAGHPWLPMSTLLCLDPFPARHPAPHACPCSAPVRLKSLYLPAPTLLAS